MTLEAAVDALNAVVATITGIRRTYADPPESINEFPCAMTYIRSGDFVTGGRDVVYGLHTLILDIYEARQVLPQAVDNAKQWPDKVLTKLLANGTLNSTVSHVGGREYFVRYEAMPMEYSGNVHYGVRFWIPVKVNY